MSSRPSALDRSEVETLLADLCVGYGFCLPSHEHDKLLANPPQEVGAFADAVFIAEGLNPETASRSTYRAVRDRVAASFARSVEKAELDFALSRQGGSQ
jgi:hypothetical protein